MNYVQMNSGKQVIDSVKEFVMNNYKDPELSLGMAAEYASVSTGYLSGLFKKESGTNLLNILRTFAWKNVCSSLKQQI